jgi:hypothetical protein
MEMSICSNGSQIYEVNFSCATVYTCLGRGGGEIGGLPRTRLGSHQTIPGKGILVACPQSSGHPWLGMYARHAHVCEEAHLK